VRRSASSGNTSYWNVETPATGMEKHQLLERRNTSYWNGEITSYWNGETPATGM
jgi:hypothetical protein